jgi:Flp pilus assembly protein TadG
MAVSLISCMARQSSRFRGFIVAIVDQAQESVNRRSVLSRLRCDASGAVMLEFAFVAIPFIAMILASLYTSLIFFSSQALETAVQTSARLMITGTAQKAATTQAQYKTQVCATLPTYMKCSRLYVDVRAAGSFGAMDMTAPTPTIDASGNVTNSGAYATVPKSQIGMVRLAYVWEAGKGPLGLDLSNTSGNNRVLVATSVFITEPYAS